MYATNSRRLASLGLGLALILGCTAGTKPNETGMGGQNPFTGTGGAGGKLVPLTGLGGLGIAGTVGSGGATSNPDAKSCMEYAVEFKPKTPTVVILVDRSTSPVCIQPVCTQHVPADEAEKRWISPAPPRILEIGLGLRSGA